MNKTYVLMRASFLQLKIYLWIILGATLVSLITTTIITLSMGNSENTSVSVGNVLTILIIFVGSVLPVSLFKRMINLGATRSQYYFGLLLVYVIWSAVFAIFNIAWLQVDIHVVRSYENTFNILEIFHWDQFGIGGMFIYQFGAYMLLISLLNLLFSGLRHFAGWIIWALVVAAIPVFTSIPSLRHQLADGLLTLLFNDSLAQGFGITIVIAVILLAGGWWFTSRRVVA